jgi:hypothetical protein
MIKKVFLMIYFSTLTLPAFSLETLMFGGGGEPTGEKTIFDEALEHLVSAKSRVNLNIKSSFNGGHSNTESIINNKLKISNEDFTPDNFTNIIKNYITKIESGAIAKGEKLLVIIDSHGQAADPASKNITHDIDMGIRGKTRGAKHASLDELKKLTALANAKGIKLGIVDFSCHSGSTQALQNENTCVITSTAPNLYGYTDFAELFYGEMNTGLSLEDVFLKAREKSASPGFPMISTEAGKEVHDYLFPLIHPYLTYQNGLANKFTPYMNSLSISGKDAICKRDENFDFLVKQIEAFEKVNGIMRSKFLGEENLLGELKSYKKIQDDLLNVMVKSNHNLLVNKTKYYPNIKDKKVFDEISWKDAVEFNPDLIKTFEKYLADSKTMDEKKSYRASLAKLKFTLDFKNKLLTEHPEFAEAAKIGEKTKNMSADLYKKASHVSQISYKLYQAKYKEVKERSAKKPNACSDFKF